MTDWPTFDFCLLRPTTPGPQKKARKYKYVRYPIAKNREHVGEVCICAFLNHAALQSAMAK